MDLKSKLQTRSEAKFAVGIDMVLLGIVLSFVAFLLLRFLLNLVTFVLFSLCVISVCLSCVCVFEYVNVGVRDWGANLCASSFFKDQVVS